MPLYEYKCQSCGDVFEVIQKFSDQQLSVHEKCGGSVERLISTSALHFKGSGWYVTDYAKRSNGKTETSDSADKAADKAKDSPDKAKKTESGKTDAPAASSGDSSSSPAKTEGTPKTESKAKTESPKQ